MLFWCVQYRSLLHHVHFGAHAKKTRTAICGFGMLNAFAMKCGLIHITYMQIPIVSSVEAAELASKYQKQGFQTLKLKVGKNLREDIEVLQAIRAVHPDCLFILDANEGYKPEEAIEVLEELHSNYLVMLTSVC